MRLFRLWAAGILAGLVPARPAPVEIIFSLRNDPLRKLFSALSPGILPKTFRRILRR